MSEKQDRQAVRKATELEQKYNFGRSFDNLNGAVVVATRAATNANAAAGNANVAAAGANAAAEEARKIAEQAGFRRENVVVVDLGNVGNDIAVRDDGGFRHSGASARK